MPAPKASDISETAAAAADAADATVKEAEKNFRDLADRVEKLVKDGLDAVRAQSRTYAESASEQLDTAQKYVVEHVQERPLAATFTALGVGVLIGLMLGGGRNR
jgi:ElaB/YqjD/DUF883 family membrane-anchored ribosome-binding protein